MLMTFKFRTFVCPVNGDLARKQRWRGCYFLGKSSVYVKVVSSGKLHLMNNLALEAEAISCIAQHVNRQ